MRDRQATDDLRERWSRYLHCARQHEQLGIEDAELAHYRWMLEEYRVSLFAQRLGTVLPVSPKRLDQQWSKVRSS